MRKSSTIAMYAMAALLCVAGIIMAIVGDVWDGRAPLGPLGGTFNIKASMPPAQAEVNLDERLNASASPNSIISAGTSIFWVTRYTKCDHDKVRESHPESGMIGKTYAEFAKYYPDCAMEIVGGQLRMVCTYDQYCPDHYIIKSDDSGNIYVYRNMEGKDKLSIVMKMSFKADAVPQDYRPLLKTGMAFGSIEEIEGLIEDAES